MRDDLEESAMACPLLFENRVAGASLVISNQANYFTPVRQQIIQDYTNLMVLALHPEDFHKPSNIAFKLMPSRQVQQPFFENFHQRVAAFMKGTGGASRSEAEIAACHQIEEEIIRSMTK